MKNYIIEFIGTFFLVLTIGMTGDPIAIGSMLMVMVYMGGHISGAHYNPAVSISMKIMGLLTTKELSGYIISQILGSMFAALIVCWLNNSVMFISVGDYDSSQILFVEAICTFALLMVIFNVAVNPKTEGNSYYGLAIGFTIFAAASLGGGISGGVYNPAVGIGPIIIQLFQDVSQESSILNSLGNLWYYIVGPIIGALCATYIYKITRD